MPACCPSGRQLLRPLLTLALEPQMTRGLGGEGQVGSGWLAKLDAGPLLACYPS